MVEVLLYVHRNCIFFLGMGAQDIHLDFHTAPELECIRSFHLVFISLITSQSNNHVWFCAVGSTVLSRQFIASILACSFLCLFPERFRDRTSKLNIINFTNFFKHLPQ